MKKIHPLVQVIFYLQDFDLENEVNVTKSKSALKLAPVTYLCKLKKIHPMVQKKIHLQDYELENEVKVTKDLMYHRHVTMLYPCKSEEYPSIGKRNISFLVEI